MDKTLDLSIIFAALKKNLKLIIGLPILFLIISTLITMFLITPKYTSSTQVIVTQKKVDQQFQAPQTQSDLQLINTYAEVIKSPRVLDTVSESLTHHYSGKELAKMISVSNKSESKVLNISVTSTHANTSKTIANTTAKVFRKEIKKIMDVDNVSVLSKAEKGEKTSPNLLINSAISVILGLALAIVFAFIKEITDKRIKDEKDVEEYLELPVIGVINRF